MAITDKLFDNVEFRNERRRRQVLAESWEKFGLLRGIESDEARQTMSQLFENQRKALIQEANKIGSGNIDAVSTVVFPIIRRVFGNVIKNQLVSVQALDRKQGVVHYLDFVGGDAQPGRPSEAGKSIYGGGKVGAGIAEGVDLGPGENEEEGFYNLSKSAVSSALGGAQFSTANAVLAVDALDLDATLSAAQEAAIKSDADLVGREGKHALVLDIDASNMVADSTGRDDFGQFYGPSTTGLQILAAELNAHAGITGARLIRRMTKLTGTSLRLVVEIDSGAGADALTAGDSLSDGGTTFADVDVQATFPIIDNVVTGSALGVVTGAEKFSLESTPDIPELDIRINSRSIETTSKKYRAKWSVELEDDLAAEHSMDPLKLLSDVMSEAILREIDVEVMDDLVKGGTAARKYWSTRPGVFLQDNGQPVTAGANEAAFGLDFTGTVSDWRETLIHKVEEVSAQVYRKTLRGEATFVVCGPSTAKLMNQTQAYMADIGQGQDGGTIARSMRAVGKINNMYEVIVSPYMREGLVLVGRKGSSNEDTGYVHATYIPLMLSQVVTDPETFDQNRLARTRYGKEMLISDFYGLVIIKDFKG